MKIYVLTFRPGHGPPDAVVWVKAENETEARRIVSEDNRQPEWMKSGWKSHAHTECQLWREPPEACVLLAFWGD